MEKKKTGYKQPPVEHQFKKGRSGNLKGRPRKAKPRVMADEAAILRRLDTEIIVVGGQSMPRREAELRKIRELSFAGNPRAIRLLDKLRAKNPPQRGGVLRLPWSHFREDDDDQ